MASNESAAVAACTIYCGAQNGYHALDRDGDGVPEYAASLRDLEEALRGEERVSAAFAAAEGLPGEAEPMAGYVFKVLAAQGSHVRGGAKSYLDADGNLTGGYALAACPASYDGTGRNTFVVSADGTVYQQDRGPESQKLFEEMTEFDPDEMWVVAE